MASNYSYRHLPEYQSWKAMWDRCTCKTHKYFKLYGGRGILVCEQWKSFEVFLTDMGPRPNGYSIDRIDGNGNYEPTNCRWVDTSTQLRNRRNVTKLSYDGEMLTLPQIAERVGLPSGVFYARIKAGWGLEKACSTPHLVGDLKNSTRIGENNSAGKLTADDVRAIREECVAGSSLRKEIAKRYGVSTTAIYLIVKRINWAHV